MAVHAAQLPGLSLAAAAAGLGGEPCGPGQGRPVQQVPAAAEHWDTGAGLLLALQKQKQGSHLCMPAAGCLRGDPAHRVAKPVAGVCIFHSTTTHASLLSSIPVQAVKDTGTVLAILTGFAVFLFVANTVFADLSSRYLQSPVSRPPITQPQAPRTPAQLGQKVREGLDKGADSAPAPVQKAAETFKQGFPDL